MHCKGIDKPLLGSVLYVLIHYVLPRDVEENLQVVWDDIQEAYDDLGTENRYGHMGRTMFTTKSQPKLKGKAAEVRDMGPCDGEGLEEAHEPKSLDSPGNTCGT